MTTLNRCSLTCNAPAATIVAWLRAAEPLPCVFHAADGRWELERLAVVLADEDTGVNWLSADAFRLIDNPAQGELRTDHIPSAIEVRVIPVAADKADVLLTIRPALRTVAEGLITKIRRMWAPESIPAIAATSTVESRVREVLRCRSDCSRQCTFVDDFIAALEKCSDKELYRGDGILPDADQVAGEIGITEKHLLDQIRKHGGGPGKGWRVIKRQRRYLLGG
jgi:hypothetical protein